MNPQETATLLAGIAAFDTRYRQQGDEAAFTVRLWSNALPHVDAGWAGEYVTWWYSRRTDKIMIAHIVGAWNQQQRLDIAREQGPMYEIGETLRQRPEWYDGLVRKIGMAADWVGARAQRDWPSAQAAARRAVDAVPSPVPEQPLVSPVEERERRCPSHSTCVCPHTMCRDGWLDEPVSYTDRTGLPVFGVGRCPVCVEAVEMRSELAPKRGRRR